MRRGIGTSAAARWGMVWVGVAVGGAATVALGEDARACSLPTRELAVGGRTILPPDGARDVPVNAEIRIRYGGHLSDYQHDPRPLEPGVRVVGPGEAVVEADTRRTSGRWPHKAVVIVHPAEPLEPRTRYEIRDRLRVPCEGWDECQAASAATIATFVTGDGPDHDPPVFDGLEEIESRYEAHDDTCGTYASVDSRLSWSSASDQQPRDWLRYHVYHESGKRVATLLEEPLGPVPIQARCSGRSDFWPVYGYSAPTGAYTVRAVDLAGNEDDNERSLETVTCDPGGCAAAPAGRRSTFGGFAVAALVVVVAGARRRFGRLRRSPHR